MIPINRSMACWITLIAMAGADEPPGPAPEAETRQAVTAVLEQQVSAWNAGDLDAFMKTYWQSEELSFSSGGRTTRGWQATSDRYRTRYPNRETMGRLTIDDLEITQLGATAAMVLGKWRLDRGTDHPRGNFTLVLQQFDGKWLIIHDHTSLLADEENDDASSKDAEALIHRLERIGAVAIRDNTRLIGFRFDNTDVKDQDLQGIQLIEGITDLSFEHTQLADEGLEHLRSLRDLEWLNLYETKVTDHGLKIISEMPSIRFLPIGKTRISDEGLKHVGAMKRLRYLGLRGNAITDAGLAHLRDLRLLEGLHLGECSQITDVGVQHLAGLTGLRELWLQKTAITDRSIEVLVKLTGLRQLVIADTEISGDGIARLRQALPKCQVLTELPGDEPL